MLLAKVTTTVASSVVPQDTWSSSPPPWKTVSQSAAANCEVALFPFFRGHHSFGVVSCDGIGGGGWFAAASLEISSLNAHSLFSALSEAFKRGSEVDSILFRFPGTLGVLHGSSSHGRACCASNSSSHRCCSSRCCTPRQSCRSPGTHLIVILRTCLQVEEK